MEGYESRPIVKSSQEVYANEYKKKQLSILMIRDHSAKDIADDHRVTSVTLYNWKKDLLGSERKCIMNNKIDISTNDETNSEKEKIHQEIEKLRKEVYRLQLEKDILEKVAQLLKKERVIDLNELTNKEKNISKMSARPPIWTFLC